MNKVIGYGQYYVEMGKVESNLKTVALMVDEANGADLIVFPELGTSGYEFVDTDEVREYAEPFGAGPTSDALKTFAHEGNMTLVIGYPEVDGKALYNSCMLATPEGELHNYRKIHLFSRENELFSPGDAPPPVIQTPAGRVGLMICFDWFYPETARILALNGAQILAHPSNLVLEYCQRAMFARCVENCVNAVTANRIGMENRAGRELIFTGMSQVLNTKGQMLIQASRSEEQCGFAEVDVDAADNKRVTEHNDLFKGRRVDLYGDLLR